MASAFKTIHIKGAGRHIFLCVEKDKPKCCAPDSSLRSWEFLKSRLRELNLVGSGVKTEGMLEQKSPPGAVAKVMRSKVGCLQVCSRGPIAVVYPEVQ